MDIAQHVPIRIITFDDDPSSSEMANEIKNLFTESGFDVEGVDKSAFKFFPYKGITFLYKERPTGTLWDACHQICFELLMPPNTDMEDAVDGSDLWIYIYLK